MVSLAMPNRVTEYVDRRKLRAAAKAEQERERVLIIDPGPRYWFASALKRELQALDMPQARYVYERRGANVVYPMLGGMVGAVMFVLVFGFGMFTTPDVMGLIGVAAMVGIITGGLGALVGLLIARAERREPMWVFRRTPDDPNTETQDAGAKLTAVIPSALLQENVDAGEEGKPAPRAFAIRARWFTQVLSQEQIQLVFGSRRNKPWERLEFMSLAVILVAFAVLFFFMVVIGSGEAA